jgi:hypothetical protein
MASSEMPSRAIAAMGATAATAAATRIAAVPATAATAVARGSSVDESETSSVSAVAAGAAGVAVVMPGITGIIGIAPVMLHRGTPAMAGAVAEVRLRIVGIRVPGADARAVTRIVGSHAMAVTLRLAMVRFRRRVVMAWALAP